MSGQSSTSGRRAAAAEKKVTALRMRAHGASRDDIAAELDVHPVTAWKYIRDAIAELPREPAEEVRALLLHRLDELYAAHAPAALAGDVKATEAVLRIIDRVIKLHRLDDDVVTAAPVDTGPRRTLRDLVGDDPERAASLARLLHEHLPPVNGHVVDTPPE